MEGIINMDEVKSSDYLISQVQAGNADLRNRFITDHLPLIRRVVRQFTRTYHVDHLDEYSIALQAFDQALANYRVDSQMPFEHYARMLMKNRLIDWARQQSRNRPAVSLSEDDQEDGLPLSERIADEKTSRIQENLEVEEEIIHLQWQLRQFKLDFARLARSFPRHKKSKMMCIRIAKELSTNEILYHKMNHSKRLPGKELSQLCQVPVKTIEKNRANIIFLALLLKSDLPQLKRYITTYERKDNNE